MYNKLCVGRVLSGWLLSVLFTISLMKVCCDESSPASYQEVGSSQVKNDQIRPMVEVKTGYFIFVSSKMRKIYKDGGLDVQLSGSYPIWKWLQAYGSVEYLERHGRSIRGDQRTRIWEIPINVGLKPIIKICKQVQYYLATGPRFFFVHQHNNSSYVNRNVTDGGVGVFANTGFNFLLHEQRLLLDIFGEYSYARVHHHSSKTNVYGQGIQVGGYTFGLGLGYVF